ASKLGNGKLRMCEDPSGTAASRDVAEADVQEYLSAGAHFGNCDGSFPAAAPAPAPAPTPAPTDPFNPGPTIVVCTGGSEQTIPTSDVWSYLLGGATVGGCADVPPGPFSLNDVVVCYGGSSVAISAFQYPFYIGAGATYGSCP
ncbi:MAG: hypothetical protein AAF791_01270, partial [Bacteroidota bacterium]